MYLKLKLGNSRLLPLSVQIYLEIQQMLCNGGLALSELFVSVISLRAGGSLEVGGTCTLRVAKPSSLGLSPLISEGRLCVQTAQLGFVLHSAVFSFVDSPRVCPME